MEFIKRLFNGNINPSVAVTVKGSQYEKLANKSLNVQKTLSEQLSEKQKKLLDELISFQNQRARRCTAISSLTLRK